MVQYSPKLRKERSRRRTGRLEQRARILIVAEGEATEVEYFKYVQSFFAVANINLTTIGRGGDPLQVVQAAIDKRDEEAKKARKSGDRENVYNSVWAVFDVDTHSRLREAIGLARRESIEVAVSNPCFEVWLLFHLSTSTPYMSSGDAQRAWASACGKSGKHIDVKDIEGKFLAAKKVAARMATQHKKDGVVLPDNNPSSDVHMLVESIGSAAEKSSRRRMELSL